MRILILVTAWVTLLQSASAAKILAVAFMTGKSHKIVYDPLLKELANRGHEVTVLTPVPSKSNRTNPKEILTFNYMEEWAESGKIPDAFEMKLRGESLNPFKMAPLFQELCLKTYALPQVKEIMNQKFDLVLFEPFMNECVGGFLYKLNTTLIMISPFSAPAELVRLLGGPAPPSFIPNIFAPYDNKMNFYERANNLFVEVMMAVLKQVYFIPSMEEVYREALNDPTIPALADILGNASLTLSNSHISLSGARPFMPDIVEVGGMHMEEAKPLPKDLEEFAQSSGEHGFIFFSMGSVLQSKNLPEPQRKALLIAFSKLKQKVLWKWETDSMPDCPPNVKLIKWAPQQDILGHPKIRVFITHGGLGSTTEAIYHGVPFVGIPMYGDQLTNIEKFGRAGISKHLEFTDLTSESIIEAVETVINDNSYRDNVKKMSRIFRDQRDDPLERAVFWTEYVLRHKGALHLRSPARDLNFFQYHSLDVIGTILSLIFLAFALLYIVIRKIWRFVVGKFTSKPVANSKKRN